MSRETYNHPSADPAFIKARELYADLFRDPSVLPTLNYTPRQIELLKPAIDLLTDDSAEVVRGSDPNPLSNLIEEGSSSSPYLFYRFPSWIIKGTRVDGWRHSVVLVNPEDGVYEMQAQETLFAATRLLKESVLTSKENEAKIQEVADKSDYKELLDIFPTTLGRGYIARIALLEENKVPGDLEKLVKSTHQTDTKDSSLEAEVWLLRAINQLLFARLSFNAAWIDQGSSYAVKLKSANEESYEIWQKLDPIKTDGNTFIPVGRKANYSVDEVQRAL